MTPITFTHKFGLLYAAPPRRPPPPPSTPPASPQPSPRLAPAAAHDVPAPPASAGPGRSGPGDGVRGGGDAGGDVDVIGDVLERDMLNQRWGSARCVGVRNRSFGRYFAAI